ncbi:MAG: hydroxymethylbilane synthase [Proteobacteria bacterium]|nr:hydroxymethylbilane synthase [Pseudomonadota bacterium]MDA1059080.1 hydroxymethylbilane synthase [Pseudomonadota bacterium]
MTRQVGPPFRIGTRGSPLALVQANEVRDRLLAAFPVLTERGIAIDVIKTSGDRIQDRNLADIGGKGLFTKEIEDALLDDRIDLAVHSLKDMPTVLPPGLVLAAALPREDPRDVLLTADGRALADLPQKAVVGTSSLRRRAQLLYRRPDLAVIDFRGNVETRITKLENGLADATVLARAGLNRLGRTDIACATLEPDDFLPAVGQGIVAVEWRDEAPSVVEFVAALVDAPTQWCADAERAMLFELDGSCRTPIAGYAICTAQDIWLRGLVLDPDGSAAFAGERRGLAVDAHRLGTDLGHELLAASGHILVEFR